MSASAAGAFPANLRINADDFGIHPRVSLAIAQCLDEGLIHSFSVLPFSDGFHEKLLKEIRVRHPEARVGAHLTVLGGGEGGLGEHEYHFLEFLGRRLTGRYPALRIREEWERQVHSLGRFLGGADKVAHLDGHQHLHLLPGLWEAARDLQEKFRIPRLRIPYEGVARSAFHKFPFGAALQAAAMLRGGDGRRRLIGFRTSTCFTVDANRDLLEEVLRHPGREYEIMVHPALPGDEGPAAGAPVKSQVAELAELRKLRDFFRRAR